jgi:predicted Rossmann-fold nucleotide-binding protein
VRGARDEGNEADRPETPGLPELPADLYAVDALLGGWRADDPRSYGATLDARTYLAAALAGLRVPADREVARQRALHDHEIGRALYDHIRGRAIVAFMGAHTLGRDTDAYRVVAESAWRLARLGHLVVTGGGPGAMEAAHLGARLSPHGPADLDRALAMVAAEPDFPHFGPHELVQGEALDADLLVRLHAWQAPAFRVADTWSGAAAGASIGIPTWLYGHEPPTPLATRHAKYFENSLREDGLLAIAKAGVVYAPGRAGTLQEVFQDAAQNHYESVDGTASPMVFLDLDGFWTVTRPVGPLLRGLFDDEKDQLLHFVTTADEVVSALGAAAPEAS